MHQSEVPLSTEYTRTDNELRDTTLKSYRIVFMQQCIASWRSIRTETSEWYPTSTFEANWTTSNAIVSELPSSLVLSPRNSSTSQRYQRLSAAFVMRCYITLESPSEGTVSIANSELSSSPSSIHTNDYARQNSYTRGRHPWHEVTQRHLLLYPYGGRQWRQTERPFRLPSRRHRGGVSTHVADFVS